MVQLGDLKVGTIYAVILIPLARGKETCDPYHFFLLKREMSDIMGNE